MKECEVQKQILDYLKTKNHYVIKTIVTNKKGVPDILGCSCQGRMFAIEVKAPGKKQEVSALQMYNITEIKRRGGISLVADSVVDVAGAGL